MREDCSAVLPALLRKTLAQSKRSIDRGLETVCMAVDMEPVKDHIGIQ